MRVCRLKIKHFRGVASGCVDFIGHTLLVGGNNIGKSTICEALDLVLGPERLFRRPAIDEHDFYCGRYLDELGDPRSECGHFGIKCACRIAWTSFLSRVLCRTTW